MPAEKHGLDKEPKKLKKKQRIRKDNKQIHKQKKSREKEKIEGKLARLELLIRIRLVANNRNAPVQTRLLKII